MDARISPGSGRRDVHGSRPCRPHRPRKALRGAALSAAGHALIERLKAQAAGAAGKLKPLFDAA